MDFRSIDEIDELGDLVGVEEIEMEGSSDEQSQDVNNTRNHHDQMTSNTEAGTKDVENDWCPDKQTHQNDHPGNYENIDSMLVPYVGMEFSSDDIAYEFYRNFALKVGFSTRKYSSQKSKTGTLIKRIFVCSKEGSRKDDKRVVGREVKHRRIKRENCKAQMIIQRAIPGDWRITRFLDTHTHAMILSPNKKTRLSSNKRACQEPQNKIAINDFHSCGIGPSKIARLINFGSHSEAKITPQQVSDHLKLSRRNNMGKECLVVLEKLMERQARDPQFYYAVEVDENQVCRSIFWADGRARNAYRCFSDVVVFDVTYRTNNFSLPFAPFTGVNHHRQSTLFGCALLADEREETFVWLFQQWLKCMWNKEPGAIITDQDPAIRNAIKSVFPNTHHRFCKWHLGLHVDEHLRSLRCSYNPQFDEDYRKWTKSRDIEDSENAWLNLKEKYKHCFEEPLTEKQKSELKSWRWLENMHDLRRHWVRAYLQKTFFAGMKSSQRSESMNAFFDGFVHSSTSLSEFIDQYDNALADRRDKELDEDFVCLNTKPDLTKVTPIESHASQIYTRNILVKFKEEFHCVFHCHHKKLKKDAENSVYEVTYSSGEKDVSHIVNVTSDCGFECSCAKFENAGLLCKHILYLMKQKSNLKYIPEKYILPRWTMNTRYTTTGKFPKVLDQSQSKLNEQKVTALEAWNFRTYMDRLYDKIVSHRDFLAAATECLNNLSEQIDVIEAQHADFSTKVTIQESATIEASQPQITIRDPSKCKTKGRPKAATRILSGKQASQTQKKPRTCKKCGGTGHYSRTCQNEGKV